MRRILGIDPGSRITGFGVIDSDGMRSVHIEHGALKLQGEALPPRLGEIYARVSALIEQHRPEVMAIEQVFMAKNAASALKLGQARGAAICAAIQHGLEVAEYTPTRVKQSVVGTGRADKSQVQHMVKMILNLTGALQADAADALAVALSHAHTHTTLAHQTRVTGSRRSYR
jgi:crossover junction endodeoxyribonuclease RuvC